MHRKKQDSNKKYKSVLKGVIKGVIKGEIKGDDTGGVIKTHASVHIRDAKTLYFILSNYIIRMSNLFMLYFLKFIINWCHF